MSACFTGRCIDRAFGRPSRSQPRVKCFHRDPKPFTPLRQRESLPAMFKIMIGSAIKRLLWACSPSAIIFAVISIVIFPLNCGTTKPCGPHIGEKAHKRITPFWANSNTAPSVIFPEWRLFVVASGFHVGPCAVYRSSFSSECFTRMSVLHKGLVHYLFVIASTRCAIPIPERCAPGNDATTAFTFTVVECNPSSGFGLSFGSGYYSQPSEFLSYHRDCFAHINYDTV